MNGKPNASNDVSEAEAVASFLAERVVALEQNERCQPCSLCTPTAVCVLLSGSQGLTLCIYPDAEHYSAVQIGRLDIPVVAA